MSRNNGFIVTKEVEIEVSLDDLKDNYELSDVIDAFEPEPDDLLSCMDTDVIVDFLREEGKLKEVVSESLTDLSVDEIIGHVSDNVPVDCLMENKQLRDEIVQHIALRPVEFPELMQKKIDAQQLMTVADHDAFTLIYCASLYAGPIGLITDGMLTFMRRNGTKERVNGDIALLLRVARMLVQEDLEDKAQEETTARINMGG